MPGGEIEQVLPRRPRLAGFQLLQLRQQLRMPDRPDEARQLILRRFADPGEDIDELCVFDEMK